MNLEVMRRGLDAPICLTWELTYACNMRCRHCLSASGRSADNELTTRQAFGVVDQLVDLGVFYANVGGGEPLVRPDFREIVEYAVQRGLGMKVSTNGALLDDAAADWIAATPYLDVQISIDGASAGTNDRIRGRGSFDAALHAVERLSRRGFRFTLNSVVTRMNVDDLDGLYDLAGSWSAELRLSRLRPSGRGVNVWQALRPTSSQNRVLYRWLMAHPNVATGDSFFHLSAFGAPLQGMNMCGAGRIVCLIDPVGDVYACPFLIAPEFRAGSVLDAGAFAGVWRRADVFKRIRNSEAKGDCASCPALSLCHGGCMAARHFTGAGPGDPDPDCVLHAAVPDREPPEPLAAQQYKVADLDRPVLRAGAALTRAIARGDRKSFRAASPRSRSSTLDETTRRWV